MTVYWKDTDFRGIIGNTGIEYDQTKEEANQKKHGYLLKLAEKLINRWIFPTPSPLFITSIPIEKNGEIRHNHMTLDYEKKLVFIVTTMRTGEKVRIISLRRASDAEEKIYHAEAIKIIAQ